MFGKRRDLESKAWYRALIVLRYLSFAVTSLLFVVVLGTNLNDFFSEKTYIPPLGFESVDPVPTLENTVPLSPEEAREIEARIDREIEESKSEKQRAVWGAMLSVLILPIGFSLWWGIERTTIYLINGPQGKQDS